MESTHSTHVPFERMTWQAICARYPDEWVLVVDIEFDEEVDIEIRSGVVIGHSPGSREVFDVCRHLMPQYTEIAHLYTGPIRDPAMVRLGL